MACMMDTQAMNWRVGEVGEMQGERMNAAVGPICLSEAQSLMATSGPFVNVRRLSVHG